MERQYTIIVFSEHHIGLLHRITTVFTRRHINIESLTVSESEVHGIHRFTIVINATEEKIKIVTKQIEKQVEVIKATYYLNEEVVTQEIALYKVETKKLIHGENVERLIRENNARVLDIEPNYIVIEKTGHPEETSDLFKKLEPYGVLQFVRSGNVAISKEIKELTSYLKELDEIHKSYQY